MVRPLRLALLAGAAALSAVTLAAPPASAQFAFGLFGVACARLALPTIPLVLGMVMGDTLEASLRQVLAVSEGSLRPFIERPMAATMLAVALLMLAWPAFGRIAALLRPHRRSTA